MIVVYILPLFLITGFYQLYKGEINKRTFLIEGGMSIVVSVALSFIFTSLFNFLL